MISPHGGRLISRIAADAQRRALLAESESLPSVTLNARELLEGRGVQRVQAHVHPAQARLFQPLRQAGQPKPVGREGEVNARVQRP